MKTFLISILSQIRPSLTQFSWASRKPSSRVQTAIMNQSPINRIAS